MLYIWEDNINLREVAIESNMEYIACPPTWFNSEAFLQMNLNKFKEIIQRVDNKSLAEVKDPIADLSDSCKTVIVVYHYYCIPRFYGIFSWRCNDCRTVQY